MRKGENGVVLLSGDNPQIAKGDGDAVVQSYIDAIPGWKQEAMRKLDALVVKTLPDVKKAMRWNSAFYSMEGQGYFMAVHMTKNYVKAALFFGAQLDPVPPVTSKDKNTRYFHIYEAEAPSEAQIADWIRQAAAIPGWKP